MHPYTRHIASALTCLLMSTGTAMAAELDGATLYTQKTCISCHGAEGKSPILPAYPKLAGQNAEYLVQQLTDIKSGVRTNAMTTAMQGIMQNVNDEEIKVLSDWLAGLSPE